MQNKGQLGSGSQIGLEDFVQWPTGRFSSDRQTASLDVEILAKDDNLTVFWSFSASLCRVKGAFRRTYHHIPTSWGRIAFKSREKYAQRNLSDTALAQAQPVHGIHGLYSNNMKRPNFRPKTLVSSDGFYDEFFWPLEAQTLTKTTFRIHNKGSWQQLNFEIAARKLIDFIWKHYFTCKGITAEPLKFKCRKTPKSLKIKRISLKCSCCWIQLGWSVGFATPVISWKGFTAAQGTALPEGKIFFYVKRVASRSILYTNLCNYSSVHWPLRHVDGHCTKVFIHRLCKISI